MQSVPPCPFVQHLKQSLAIHSVTVGSYDAEFVHHDPIANISFANAAEAKDCHRHPELKRKLYSALADSDEGELSIALPHEVLLPLLSHESRHPCKCAPRLMHIQLLICQQQQLQSLRFPGRVLLMVLRNSAQLS